MTKKTFLRSVLLTAALLCLAMAAGGASAQTITLPNSQLVTAFPDGWTVVTPDTASRYAALLGVSADVAADVMRADNVIVAAFGTGADIAMRVQATETETASVHFDIDRYTTAMRNAIRADYLDAAVWKLTGLRFSEAEWKNPSKTGRYLRLTYTRRSDGEIVARGLMAFTVHNGREIMLGIEATGRALTSKEVTAFDTWIASTKFEPQLDMPPLPTGLTFEEPFIQETNSLTVKIKGTTQPGATVTGSLVEGTNAPFMVGETTAKSGGTFTLTLTLPREGSWTLVIESVLEGYAATTSETPLSSNSRRIPINLLSPLEGEIWDAQPRLAGKTLAGTEITVSDNGAISKRTTSDGAFSIKLNPDPAGTRVVTVTLRKRDYDERTVKYVFERRWHSEDYLAYLKTQVKKVTYAALIENPSKYAGAIAAFPGTAALDDGNDGNASFRLATAPGKDNSAELYCVSEEDVAIAPEAQVTVYGIITGDMYTIPGADAESLSVTLPVVRVLLILTD